jgi:uncharacterized membrane protein YgdD (TMEM256/DUF423 family)
LIWNKKLLLHKWLKNINMNKFALLSGSILGFLTVAIGAFGAHGLKNILESNNRIVTFETAVLYQAIHALALLLVGLLASKLDSSLLSYAAYAFVFGTMVFSGSLYTLSITNITFFGAITPIGGLFFLIGWFMLFLAILKL